MALENTGNNNSNLSALEKAKLLKEQLEAKKVTQAKQSEAEKAAKQQELDEKYIVDKDYLNKLKSEKAQTDTEHAQARQERAENIHGQRAAIHEILGDNSDPEATELFKESKKDIFGEEDEKLNNLKSQEEDLKNKSQAQAEEIKNKEETLNRNQENTSETKAEKEKEEKINQIKQEFAENRKEMENVLTNVMNILNTEEGKSTFFTYCFNDKDFNRYHRSPKQYVEDVSSLYAKGDLESLKVFNRNFNDSSEFGSKFVLNLIRGAFPKKNSEIDKLLALHTKEEELFKERDSLMRKG